MIVRLSLLYMAKTCRNDLDSSFDTVIRSCSVGTRAVKILGRVIRRIHPYGYQQGGMSL